MLNIILFILILNDSDVRVTAIVKKIISSASLQIEPDDLEFAGTTWFCPLHNVSLMHEERGRGSPKRTSLS